jgi:hypothetical protein
MANNYLSEELYGFFGHHKDYFDFRRRFYNCWNEIKDLDYDDRERMAAALLKKSDKEIPKIIPKYKFTHKEPKWLRKLVDERGNPWSYHIFGDCVDHVKFMGDMILLEPYAVDISDMESLVKTCRQNNLYFTISGKSFHFPGRTTSIRIVPKPIKEPQVIECHV